MILEMTVCKFYPCKCNISQNVGYIMCILHFFVNRTSSIIFQNPKVPQIFLSGSYQNETRLRGRVSLFCLIKPLLPYSLSKVKAERAMCKFSALSKAMCKKFSAQESHRKIKCLFILMSTLASQSYHKNHRNFSNPPDIKKQYKV